jgi:hypothetical protein
VKGIEMAKDGLEWRTFVVTVMNLRVLRSRIRMDCGGNNMKLKIQVNVVWNEEKLHFLSTSEWAKTSMYSHNLKNVNCAGEQAYRLP